MHESTQPFELSIHVIRLKGGYACTSCNPPPTCLTMGRPLTPECQRNLDILIQVCHLLNIPLAIQKVEGPTTCLDFLGIILDTIRMEARLPDEKLTRIYHTIANWLDKQNATKREILSLVGLLQHATKIVCPGRIFVHRMYSVAAKVQEMDHYTRLNKEFRSDLYWWHTFITSWNGISFVKVALADPTPQLTTSNCPNTRQALPWWAMGYGWGVT